jgi:WD40 repeat protein
VWSWDAAQQRWNVSAELIGHLPGYAITAGRFLPDGRQLLTACEDNPVMRWEVATGRRLKDATLKHTGGVRDMDVAPDGRRAVTLCVASERDGDVTREGFRLVHWDLEQVRELNALFVSGETVTSVTFDQDASGVLVASMATGGKSAVRRWNLATAQYDLLWSDGLGRGSVWAAFPSPDGSQVLTVGGSYARLWDAKSGQPIQTFSPHGPLTDASFSPSGKLAVTASTDGAVKVWSVDEQAQDLGHVRLKIPQAHHKEDKAYPVHSAVFGPQAANGDTLLLTAGDDGTAKLWDISGQTPRELKAFAHPASVRRAVFSPDGTLVATACLDGTARLWNVQTGEGTILGGQKSHTLAVLCAAFSPDGKRLATGSDDNTIKIWDVEAKTELAVLKGHTASITSVAFSPDGRRIVSGSQDAMAKVWDAGSGQQVLNLNRHAAEVTAVGVSYDGRRLLTASSDQLAIVWASVNISPTVTLDEQPLTYSTLGQAVVIDPQASVYDPDAPHFGGGQVTAAMVVATGEAARDEQLAIQSDAAGAGGVQVADSQVLFDFGDGAGPVPIGSLSGAGPRAVALTVTLTERATKDAVQSLLRHITYTSRTALTSERRIRFQLADGQGGVSHPAEKPLIAVASQP